MILSLILAATLATKADVQRVTAAELRALIEKGDAVAVDVRGSVPWRYGHIPGAVWLPLGRVDQQFGKLPQDKLIVTYCTCKAEETSLEGAMKLANEHGFQRVAVLHGGYPAWKDAGFPVEEERTVHFEESKPAPEPAPAPASGGGRLAPPDAIQCDRNQLTSYAGRIARYSRTKGKTVLVMDTSADTVETLTVVHPGTDDPSRFYLLEGQPFTKKDWAKVERKKGELQPNLSAVAWVCTGGPTVIDWRPGVTFSGAE
ncbi:MAG TPA: rhodanese-like domain-containing protein [Thermoanaerobaculia bacterium]|nr:rhodanese-like domain-containing protein [Thermoanaerobaculia bacterium]